MPKPRGQLGEKNLIGSRLKELRKREHLSRIETNKRFVTDIRLRAIAEVFQVTYEFLMDGKEDS